MRILAIGAHLDDIEIAVGGVLAKAILNGHEVKTLIMSKSGYTNREGKIQRSDELAEKEGTEALHILGVNDISTVYTNQYIVFVQEVDENGLVISNFTSSALPTVELLWRNVRKRNMDK